MLEYDVETKSMKSESSEPVAFFITMFIVIIWALVTCVLSRASSRWMPLMVLAIAIARTMLFVADKSYTAVTVNGKIFMQATL
jgi:low affinity Fe/Cu permease